jgi:hypothetical protein
MMDWLALFLSWVAAQFAHWSGSIPSFISWITAQFPQWLATTLGTGNVGHPPQNPPGAINSSATPELDSLVLFGTGLLGAGGYVLTRLRARRSVSDTERP